MIQAKKWIEKAKKRCKYIAIVIILLAFVVPIGYSSFGEAETDGNIKVASQTTTEEVEPSAVQSDTSAKGFQGSGAGVVHAKTTTDDAIQVLQNVRNTLSGTRLDIKLDQPFSQGNNGFANGKSCLFATVEVIAPQGVFLKDEPILIEKPDPIKIEGPTNTSDGGSFRWCITSTQPIQASITTKLANFPQTQTTTQVNFLPTYNITNKTQTNNFIFNRPVTFLAQIDPWMVQGLKEAKLVYTTNRCGAISCDDLTLDQGLNCSFSGVCSATVPAEFTQSPFDKNTQSFDYTFLFEDTNGNKFQQSNTGTLQFP